MYRTRADISAPGCVSFKCTVASIPIDVTVLVVETSSPDVTTPDVLDIISLVTPDVIASSSSPLDSESTSSMSHEVPGVTIGPLVEAAMVIGRLMLVDANCDCRRVKETSSSDSLNWVDSCLSIEPGASAADSQEDECEPFRLLSCCCWMFKLQCFSGVDEDEDEVAVEAADANDVTAVAA